MLVLGLFWVLAGTSGDVEVCIHNSVRSRQKVQVRGVYFLEMGLSLMLCYVEVRFFLSLHLIGGGDKGT